MRITRASNVDRNNVKYQLLLVGASGAGKTWRSVAATKDGAGVFAVLTEANGVGTALNANPNVALPTFEDDGGVRHFCKTYLEVEQCMAYLESGAAAKDGITTAAFDGFTEIQNLKRDEMLSEKQRALTQAGSKAEPQFVIQDWGVLKTWGRDYLRRIRGLNYDVVMTVLAEKDKDEDGRRFIGPNAAGSITSDLPSFFTAVCYVFVDEKERYLGMFSGPSTFPCKAAHPLRGIIDGSVADWFTALRSGNAIDTVATKVVGTAPATQDPSAPRRAARG